MNEILTIVEHQTITISKDRNIKNAILSYEDRELLFDIEYTDKKGKKRFLFSNNGKNRIKACSIVGSVSLKNGLTIEILPKFANGNLTETLKKQYRETLVGMIRVSNEKNFITTQSQSGKISMGEMPLINYIIELFTSSLVNTLRQNLYQTYTTKIKNTSDIRGNILVSKTIQNNFIDKSKVYCSYNKQSHNNLLMQVFKTLARLLMQDDNLSYNTKQNLYEIHLLLDGVDIINLKEQDFKKVIFNRLNERYEILFNQANFIFNKYMPFSSKINSTPFWSILFSMDYLFEKFLAYLFRKSDINFNEQSVINCFENKTNNMMVSAKPDFIIENNLCIADAKWKLLQKDKTLYGLNAQNFWQLFSYMNLVNQNEQINGYFIVPKNNDEFDNEIIFDSVIDGNKIITIISIDFSLSFIEILNNFYFTVLNKELRYKQYIELAKESKEDIANFDFEELIEELEILSKNKHYMKTVATLNKDKFTNIINLKNIQKVPTRVFKEFIKDNINREKLALDNLMINSIPANINKLKKLTTLKIQNNNISSLPEELFLLKKLEVLNISDNKISKLPDSICNISLKELYLDMELINANKLLIDALIQKYNTKVYYPNNNDYVEYKIKDIDERKNFKNENDSFQKLNYRKNAQRYIEPNAEELTQCYSNSIEDIRKLVSIKDLKEDLKIILFFRNYKDLEFKREVQSLLIKSSNEDIVNSIFSRKINHLVTYIENDFSSIYSLHKNWIYGFVFCTNNEALHKIKEIIAKNTDSQKMLETLSNEENEPKLLNEIVENKISNRSIIDRIVEFTIKHNYSFIAHSLIKRKNILFHNLKLIVNNFNLSSLIVLAKTIDYEEENELIKEWIADQFPEPLLTLNNYDDCSKETKYDFSVEAKFNTYPDDLIKKLCYEEDQDILMEILADKHNSLKLRFVILIYVLNFKNINFKNKEIFPAIKKHDNEHLNRIIDLNEKSGVKEVSNYIKSNFKYIDKEILLGYTMSNVQSVFYVRDIICDATIDLDILNELSKNKDDEFILKKIIFKARDNKEFQNIVKGYSSIYSNEILTRIVKYNQYYKAECEYCLISQIAKDYFYTTIETKFYIFNQYAKPNKDKVLLKILHENIKNSTQEDLKRLNILIINTLKEIENTFSNKIEFDKKLYI